MSYIGSFFGINAAGNALDAFQEAIDVTSDNISNVNTPGASRQVVNLTQTSPVSGSPFAAAHIAGTLGNGVTVASIQRIHDDSYDALFRGASASQNYFTTEQTQLGSLQSAFGEPNNGVNSYFTAFQNAVAQLVDQAGTNSTSSRQNVLTSAQALTQALNQSSGAITTAKAQVIAQAGSAVTSVNTLLDQIAALNGQIRASTAVGDSPNQFEDQRDEAIDQLSQYLSTQTSIQADGSALVTVNGQALVNDTVAYHLAAPTIGTASNGAPTFKIDFQSTPPAASTDPGITLGSGQLAAYADVYNNKLTSYGQQLDGFASSLADEVNRITQAGYDQNGVAGTALFAPATQGDAITAGDITVNISDPSQLPAALASTDDGDLVQPMNSANNVVDTAAAINGYGDLADPPPAAGITGTLTVTVDGVAQTMNYDTNTTDDSVQDFISHFNGMHYGVTASYNATSQSVVFARDPSNTDPLHRALQATAGSPTSPSFTIADSNNVATPGASLLGALGAANISGVTQDSTNAFGSADNGAANALLNLFSANVGVPALQTSSGLQSIAAPGVATIALPAGVDNVQVGDVLTVDAQPGGVSPQENVTVSAVSFDPATGIESFTATYANAHAAGFSIASAQTQTLGASYGQLVAQMGTDAASANTGVQSQTALAQSLNTTRQSIDGINIDEETQNLIKYQNAYAAAARTINIMDQMLGTIVNTLGTNS